MSATAFGLVLAAALMHATWNLAAKRAQGGQLFLLLCSIMALGIYALPVAFVVAEQGLPRTLTSWLAIALSAVVHIGYSSVLQHAYRQADLSVVYPVARGTGPLLSVGLATWLLGERPSAQALVGVAIVIVGVFWLAGGRTLLKSPDARVRAGLFWGSITGLFIASYTTVDAYTVRSLAVAPLLLDYVSHALRVTATAPYAWRHREETVREWKRTFRYALVIALLGPLGYLLVLHALRFASVSYVAPARELSMLFAALLGVRLLAEGEAMRRVACAALIAVGVGLIALSR